MLFAPTFEILYLEGGFFAKTAKDFGPNFPQN